MRIRFIWPGKTKDKRLRGLADEYLKRLARFARCDVVEVREGSGRDPSGLGKASKRILEAIDQRAFAILLDVAGEEWSSRELADEVRSWENDATKEVVIIIGGPEGVSDEVTQRAQKRWRLSRLTLTHEMARVVALEQIYRAYTIIHGLSYQKG